MLSLAERAQRETGCDKLCLAGGVALNALANQAIAESKTFSDIFVQPAAGDAGGALGAAYLGARDLGDRVRQRAEQQNASHRQHSPFDPALGVDVDVARARAIALALGLVVTGLSDPFAHAANALAEGHIVPWVFGRSEWGPRALGHRSLLADPRSLASRERINRVVKKREPFRPFAPSVLSASVDQYFRGVPTSMDPFMTTVRAVQPERASEIPAVVHHDGSARIQSVQESSGFGRLLEAFASRTDVPMLLNTSLNGPGEPIAASSEAALFFLTRHAVDRMVMSSADGDAFEIRKPGARHVTA